METKEGIMDDTLEIITTELQRCKDNEQELYSLDRQRAAIMGEIQQKVVKIEANQETMKDDLKDFKSNLTSLETKVENIDNKMDKVEVKVDDLQNEVKQIHKYTKEYTEKKQWQPKDYCVIIVALVSLAGTVLTCLLK